MFELLTLIQTEKALKHMSIVLYGEEFWREIINYDALVKWGVISKKDLKLFKFCSTVDDAYGYLTKELKTHYINKTVKNYKI